jgi:hypothetical protein
MACTFPIHLLGLTLTLLAQQPTTAPADDEQAQLEREREALRWQMPARVEGTVTDASTGEPIARFKLIPGLLLKRANGESRIFAFGEAQEFEGGQYEWINEGRQPDVIVRIEADGYEPAVSEGLSDHIVARFDAKLKRAANITGAVVTPDGKPADDAMLLFATKDAPVHLNNEEAVARGPDQSIGIHATTGADGRFEKSPLVENWRVVVLHESGTAELSRDEFPKDGVIQLQPWARIEGELKVGSKPGAGESILHYPVPINTGERPQVNHISNVTCDENGEFVLNRVKPGKGHIARQVEMRGPGDLRLMSLSRIDEVEAKAGQTTKVALGGAGRPVVGRVSRAGGIPENWFANGNSLIGKRPPGDRSPRQYHFAVEPDGTFRIDDVEPGEYRLSISFSEVPGTGARIGASVAHAQHAFIVPEIPGGRSDEPLDLGELPVKPWGGK